MSRKSLTRIFILVLLAASAIPIVRMDRPAGARARDAQPRRVLFEFFTEEGCSDCPLAGAVVEQMTKAYADLPIDFMEQAVVSGDAGVNRRINLAASALGQNVSFPLPLAIADSGYQLHAGPGDYVNVYKKFIADELNRPSEGEIDVRYELNRRGGLMARVTITNNLGVSLTITNLARVEVLVYEEVKVYETSHTVRAGDYQNITAPLDPGKSARYSLYVLPEDMQHVTNRQKMHVVGFVEYRPGGEAKISPYHTLNAGVGVEGPLTLPTQPPTATSPPTEEPSPTPPPPTETPTPKPALPTLTPTPSPIATSILPTSAVVKDRIYLPTDWK